MDFAVTYRTARPVCPEDASAIIQAVEAANQGRTWLSCEGVSLIADRDGHLRGSSKPSFAPDAGEVELVNNQVLPDGTFRDLVAVLCKLSIDHGVEWEVRHGYDPEPIGLIQRGVADEEMIEEIEALADLADVLSDPEDEESG